MNLPYVYVFTQDYAPQHHKENFHNKGDIVLQEPDCLRPNTWRCYDNLGIDRGGVSDKHLQKLIDQKILILVDQPTTSITK
jgi:hypothetical protein